MKKRPPKGTLSWYKFHAIEDAKELAKRRDGFTCQVCGKKKGEAQIQGSHVFSVSVHPHLAGDVENIKALCAYHHKWWWHSSPIDASDWFQGKFPERIKSLKNKIDKIEKGFRPDWKSIYESHKNALREE